MDNGLFLRVKLHGLGWGDSSSLGVTDAPPQTYKEMREEIYKFLTANTKYSGVMRTIEVSLCNDLDGIHFVREGSVEEVTE